MSGCGPVCSGQHIGFTESTALAVSEDSEAPAHVRFSGRAQGHSRTRGPYSSLPLPARCMLSYVLLEGLAGAIEVLPTEVTWWLTADPEGCVVLTDVKTTAWVTSSVSGQSGGAAIRIDQVWQRGLQSDELHLWFYVDTGTGLQVRPRVAWYTLCDLDLTPEHRAQIVAMGEG